MNKKFLYIFGTILSIIFLYTACEENNYPYGNVDPASISTSTVLLGMPNQTIVVDPDQVSTNFSILASVWGGLPKQEVNIPIVIDSTDLPSEAYIVNGSGFTIPQGSNNGSVSIDLVAEFITPGVVYSIYYSMGTPSVSDIGVNELGSSGVITLFNPGPLGPWIGNYSAFALSQHEPGSWDENWEVTTALDPADPLNNILIYGIAGSTVGLVATIDINAGTITIAEGQNIGDVYGYGDSYVYYGEAPWTYLGGDLVGTVDPDGTITINGMYLTAGPYDWDIFDVSFTKDTKKSAGSLYIPKYKKPTKK